jgi:hypothetical protein
MNIALENLDKITDILKILQILQLNLVNETSKQKRWLSTKELSQYIPYTVETINKKIQNGYFLEGVHFYQKEKTRFFDREKIDEWIISKETTPSNNPNYNKKQEIIERISNSLIS